MREEGAAIKAITPGRRTVANIHTADYRRWLNEDGSELADQSFLQLDDSFPPGSGFYVYRMDPGAVTTPHEQTCRENFLILEGELIDNDGCARIHARSSCIRWCAPRSMTSSRGLSAAAGTSVLLER